MASGQDIPYQMRPNKFIDRQIFLDLLNQVCSARGSSNYVYVSMGGKHLVDQEAVYRRVGIENLFSFDGAAWIVERQEKNLPHGSMICDAMHSSELPGSVDTLAEIFSPADNFVFWLDYTAPSKRFAQLQELSQLLQKCKPLDVIRITLNADPFTLRGDWQGGGFESPAHYRAHRLRNQLGEFYPASTNTVSDDEVPAVLVEAVSLVVSQASNATRLDYRPVLLTTYADGQCMLTVTLLTLESAEQSLPNGLADWEFLPNAWNGILDISAPDLSMREKILIDQFLTQEPEDIVEEIGFRLAEDLEDSTRAIGSYKRLHRYYPTFYAIGIQ